MAWGKGRVPLDCNPPPRIERSEPGFLVEGPLKMMRSGYDALTEQ